MTHDHKNSARAFYDAFAQKKWDVVGAFLHPGIILKTPLSTLHGKEAYLIAAKEFSAFVEDMRVRHVLMDASHAVVIYDHVCAQPVGAIESAALLTFEGELIKGVEIFHDTSAFTKIKDEFSA